MIDSDLQDKIKDLTEWGLRIEFLPVKGGKVALVVDGGRHQASTEVDFDRMEDREVPPDEILAERLGELKSEIRESRNG